MKKLLIGILFLFPSSVFGATFTEYVGSIDDTNNFGTGQYYSQTWQATASSTDTLELTGFALTGSMGNAGSNCTTFNAKVTLTTYAGTIVRAENFNCSDLGAYTGSPTSHTFTFSSSTPITTSDVYWLTIHPNDGSASDGMRWATDTTSPGYTLGSFGSAGTLNTAIDTNFKVFGTYTTPGGGGGTSTSTATSTSATTEVTNGLLIILIAITMVDFFRRYSFTAGIMPVLNKSLISIVLY